MQRYHGSLLVKIGIPQILKISEEVHTSLILAPINLHCSHAETILIYSFIVCQFSMLFLCISSYLSLESLYSNNLYFHFHFLTSNISVHTKLLLRKANTLLHQCIKTQTGPVAKKAFPWKTIASYDIMDPFHKNQAYPKSWKCQMKYLQIWSYHSSNLMPHTLGNLNMSIFSIS